MVLALRIVDGYKSNGAQKIQVNIGLRINLSGGPIDSGKYWIENGYIYGPGEELPWTRYENYQDNKSLKPTVTPVTQFEEMAKLAPHYGGLVPPLQSWKQDEFLLPT